MQQQQELQQVQQQLLAAQTLIVQHQPFLQGLNRGPQGQQQQQQQQQPPSMIIQHPQHQQPVCDNLAKEFLHFKYR